MTVERTPWTPEMVEQLRALKAEGKMAQEIADIMGMTLTTIHTAWQRYRPGPNRGPMSPPIASIMKQYDEAQGRVRFLEKEQRDLTEALLLMVKRVRPYEVPVKTIHNTIKFGLIGDTHIGSGYQRLDALKAFYHYCHAEGVETVLHAGDVIDGWHVYRGQEFELHPNARSWNDQRAMFEAEAPKINGITTIFITGNHEASFRRSIGMDVGSDLHRVRPDWKPIGADVGVTILRAKNGQKFSVKMVHPADRGSAYALSYRLQKFIEAIPGGEKPDMLVLGHYHKSVEMPDYRNVRGFYPGCFQSQTPFMAAQGAAAQVGGWVIEVVLGEHKKLTGRIKTEWIDFKEPKS